MRITRRLVILAGSLALSVVPFVASTTAVVSAQVAPLLLQHMVGTWNVQQRMWPGAGAKAVPLPPAVARRLLVGGAFLQEVMTSAPGVQPAFTRIAYVDANPVNQEYEYFSLDTRAPQMMNERSSSTAATARAMTLNGGTFVAPRWGEGKNVAFRYRLVLGPIANKQQVVQLYLTPVSGANAKEFLAFEYVYTKA